PMPVAMTTANETSNPSSACLDLSISSLLSTFQADSEYERRLRRHRLHSGSRASLSSRSRAPAEPKSLAEHRRVEGFSKREGGDRIARFRSWLQHHAGCADVSVLNVL